jgi:hypothetical protein
MTFKLPDPSPTQGDAPLAQIVDKLAGGEKPQLDPPAIDVASDGLTTGADPLETIDTDTGEPIQIAGLGSALKGIVSSIGKKVGQQAASPPPVHPPAPPAAAASAAAIPKPKTLPEIKQGVIERAAKLPPQDVAAQQAQDITARAASPIPQAVEPGRTEWRNFRSDKLQTSDDIKALIDDVAMQNDGFTDARRGVVSWQQTADEAQQYNLEDILRRKPAEAWNAAQLTAGRDILLELGGRIQAAAQKVSGAGASADDMLAFRQMLAQHAAVQETLQGAVSEAGRSLNIMKAAAVPAGRLRSKAVLDMLDQMGGEDVTRRLAEMVIDTGGNPAALANVTRKGWLGRTNDAITEVWINGLLSGPKTHIINTVSNSLTALMQIPERAVAGAGRAVAKAFGAGDARREHHRHHQHLEHERWFRADRQQHEQIHRAVRRPRPHHHRADHQSAEHA